MASTHKHIRSTTANKRPTTAIAEGQIALNTNSASPGLFFKDSTGATIIKIGPVHVGATAPNVSPAAGGSAGNSTGEIWLDSSLTPVGVKIWTGAAWVNATPVGSTTVQGLLELATDAETQTGVDTARAVTPAALQSKLSDSTSTTSATTIASSTAVKAAYDLAGAALPKTGGTVTGNLEIGTTGSLTFEGATADNFETTIAVVDPTADRTITLPNVTGTVVTTGDTGTVTSTMLLDGTILNEDINASAAIVDTKLATIATAGKVNGTALTGTIPSTVLGNSATFVGTTSVVLNRSSANQALTGITSVALPGATSGTITVTPAAVAGTTAITVPATTGTLVTTGDSGTVTSTMLLDGTIANADVNASAAIAGTKISPDFGSQTIATTGIVSHALGTAAAPTLTFTGDTNTGIYSPAADQVAISTSGTGRLFVDASGNVGISRSAPQSGLDIRPGVTGTLNAITMGYGRSANPTDAIHKISWASDDLIIEADSANTISSNIRFYNDGTEKMVLDASGRLGVGTSSPSNTAGFSQQLQLTGNLPCISIDNTGTGANKYSLGVNSVGAFGIWDNTASTFRMYINSSGNVGVGTTSPAYTLDVVGDLRVTNSGGGTIIANRTSNPGSIVLQHSGTETGQIQAVSGGGLNFYIGSTPSLKATLDSSGRLLVGTSSALPVYYNSASTWNGIFQVARAGQDAVANFSIWDSSASTYTTYGGAQIHLSACKSGTVGSHTSGALASGDSIASINFNASDGSNFRNAARIEAVVDAASGTADVPGRLVFSVTADGASSPTERMRITNGGYLKASNNGTYFDSSAATHEIYSTGNTSTLRVYNASTSYTSISVPITVNTAASTGWSFLRCYHSTDFCFNILGNGNVVNTNNSYGAISDVKLKENIVDANSQWNDLKALQVRNYNFKEGQTHTQIGLVAQEVELVSPGLVTESPDRDEDGNDLGTVTKSVNYSVLYMKAVKALQEAMERIETLEAKVAALEGV